MKIDSKLKKWILIKMNLIEFKLLTSKILITALKFIKNSWKERKIP